MLTSKEIKVLKKCVEMANDWRGSLDPLDFDDHDEFIKSAMEIISKLNKLNKELKLTS